MSDESADISGDDAPAVQPPGPPCRHLRHNGSYIFTDGLSDDTEYEGSSSTTFWCLKTMKSFGPDDDFVGRDDCRRADRSCHEPV